MLGLFLVTTLFNFFSVGMIVAATAELASLAPAANAVPSFDRALRNPRSILCAAAVLMIRSTWPAQYNNTTL